MIGTLDTIVGRYCESRTIVFKLFDVAVFFASLTQHSKSKTCKIEEKVALKNSSYLIPILYLLILIISGTGIETAREEAAWMRTANHEKPIPHKINYFCSFHSFRVTYFITKISSIDFEYGETSQELVFLETV